MNVNLIYTAVRPIFISITLLLGAIACQNPSPPVAQNISTKPSVSTAKESPSPSVQPQIIDRPIEFTERRKQLTLEYIRLHYDPKATSIAIDPQVIVIHWTDTPSLSATFNTFNPELLPGSRPELKKGGAVNVSSQFVIDRDGKIYRLMPETTLARHVIGLNHAAIGIENVGSDGFPLTSQQLQSNADHLVRYLAVKYPKIRFIIGHYEYQKFRNSPLWKELLPGYITYKSDPSPEFMKQLRSKIADLKLCSEPNCQYKTSFVGKD